jgi:hypothetical protein
VYTPTVNADGTYLPMPWTGARRIENERLLYREHQRMHHEKFPEYAAGWRQPSETTVSRVWKLVRRTITGAVDALSPTERAALVVALDAAFDCGFITVADDGTVIVASGLDEEARRLLGLDRPLSIDGLAEAHRTYLPWHREQVFRASGT